MISSRLWVKSTSTLGPHVEGFQRDPIIRLKITQEGRGPVARIVSKVLIAQLAEFQQQHDRNGRIGGREVRDGLPPRRLR